MWKKGFACPCAYLACMSSFWAMCMCVAPAAQQLPHYMHTPAGKQLHVFVCMYSSFSTASTIHVHPSWQTASCLCIHVLQLMHSPAGKQLHACACMYSSCPTASISHAYDSWQTALHCEYMKRKRLLYTCMTIMLA